MLYAFYAKPKLNITKIGLHVLFIRIDIYLFQKSIIYYTFRYNDINHNHIYAKISPLSVKLHN